MYFIKIFYFFEKNNTLMQINYFKTNIKIKM